MRKLMDELMAEAQRVNALEVEVERTVEMQKDRVQQERKDKLQSIGIFLDEMLKVLIEADATKMFDNRPTFVVLNRISYDDDGYKRTAGITFYTDKIYSGGYYMGARDCSKQETFESACCTGGFSESMKAIVDAWSPELESDIEKAIAEYVKIVLAKRMEKMQKTLQQSNDTYAKYVKE